MDGAIIREGIPRWDCIRGGIALEAPHMRERVKNVIAGTGMWSPTGTTNVIG